MHRLPLFGLTSPYWIWYSKGTQVIEAQTLGCKNENWLLYKSFYTIQEKIKRALKKIKIHSVQLENSVQVGDNYQNHCVPGYKKFYKMRPRKQQVVIG